MSDHDSIFSVIQSHPGCSRDDVRKHLTAPISERELTNALTRLRRHGRIQNQGTRKNPIWHAKPLEEHWQRRQEAAPPLVAKEGIPPSPSEETWEERWARREEAARLLVEREGIPCEPFDPSLYELPPYPPRSVR